ncbi:RNA polymerase subunit sigma-24 [Pedobacter yulinensis]|uniref:RNA polymerase subunit sigma-24 n=1 Tax=Pedobacter yulinensis TaxID=2126353 RepID=A0A2T3HGR2_9SPHI|nr:sigma-70 family RNA polymerase sigma factor [Pedobacter yulinensis]PST81634.1 RNA polymerase subunit sigma-24 [Pedobacter yulinensis]
MHEPVDITSTELFQLIGQGDEQAFATLYDRYWESLFSQACKRLNDPEKSRDLVQNVFMDIWNRRGTLRVDQPEAYLRTAIKFQVLKETSRKTGYFTEVFEHELISGIRADDILVGRELEYLLKLFIAALPAKRRQIFQMHYLEARSTAEIALSLGLNRKTVQNQLHTASQALRLRLQQLFMISAMFGCFFK